MKKCLKCEKAYPDHAGTCVEPEQDIGKYGSLLKRFFSFLIDSIILGIVSFLVFQRYILSFLSKVDISGANAAWGFFMISTVLCLALAILTLLYGTFFIGKYGSTLGQKLCKLKVLTAAGGELGYKKAFLRGLAFLLYYLPYITMIFAIFAVNDKKKQAIHDKMCQTIVVNV
ncbi:MAG: RDD family protein [Candidatus Omnitrophota bacterium]